MRGQGEDDRGSVAARSFLEGLRTDQHADIEEDRRNRNDRNHRHHQRDDPEPCHDEDHDAGGGRVTDTAAHRFPAGMADINRIDIRVAHQAADQADNAIGGEHARGGVAIARDGSADDVVHRFDQIVNAERNRGDQNHAEIAETMKNVTDGGDRNRKTVAGN